MTIRLDDAAARSTAAALDAALDELEQLPDSRARTLAFDAVDALLQLHGEALARIVAAHRDGTIANALSAGDEVISQLLVVHGLLRMPAQPASELVQLRRRDSEPAEHPGAHAQCELCAEPIAGNHRHLADIEQRRLLCACPACAILFDRTEVGGRYRLVPRRYQSLDSASMESGWWDRLQLPVDIAFLLVSSKTGAPVASYPGPMGTTESEVPLPAWSELASANPVVATLLPDVEAVLVRRTRGARDYWLVPVDECYTLAGIMRSTWQGISGGDEMRGAVDAFFKKLASHAASPTRAPVAAESPTREFV